MAFGNGKRSGHCQVPFHVRAASCATRGIGAISWCGMIRVRFLLSIGGIWLLSAAPGTADPPSRIPIEDFVKDAQFGVAEISPNGKQIAFLAPDHNRLNIWVCETGAPIDSAKLVTHDSERGISDFRWTRDSRWLLYNQDFAGDENFHIFRVDPSAPNKPAVDLTPFKGAQAKIVNLPNDAPNSALILWNNRDPHSLDLGVLDITNGAYMMVAKNAPHKEAYLFDSHGEIAAYSKRTLNGKVDIMVRDSESGDRTVTTYETEDHVTLWGFNANRSALFLSISRGSNTKRLTALDVKTGEETVIDEDPEYDLSEVLMTRRTHQLVGVAYEKEHFEIKPLTPEFKHDLEILSKALAGPVHLGSMTDDEQRWIVYTTSPTDPGSIYLYDRSLGKVSLLGRPCPWLKREALAEMKPIAFNSRDGWKLHGYLSLPRGVEPHGLPTIVMVHGGPNARDTWGFHPTVQFLANRGYAVLQINFRGSTGYGDKFSRAGDREWGGKMLDDVIDGARWVVKQGVADPKRMAVFGGSFGGYAALSALAFHPKVFACGVDLSGPSNLITFLQNQPPYWADARASFTRRVGDPEKDADFLRSRSPLFSAKNIEAPVFIAQGENDPRVKRSESDQMVEALRKNGKSVEYLLMADEGHDFATPENNLELFQRIEAFLEKYLK
jgi:dipeptidyl aminopeptidase/acylaminoacyl peptidase